MRLLLLDRISIATGDVLAAARPPMVPGERSAGESREVSVYAKGALDEASYLLESCFGDGE